MVKKRKAMLMTGWESVQHQFSNGYVYIRDGEGAFQAAANKRYSKELKEQAVIDHLGGRGSQQGICQRYGIRTGRYARNLLRSIQIGNNLFTSESVSAANFLLDI